MRLRNCGQSPAGTPTIVPITADGEQEHEELKQVTGPSVRNAIHGVVGEDPDARGAARLSSA